MVSNRSDSSQRQVSLRKSQLRQHAPALTDETNQPGQIVWATIEGYAPWPAMILNDSYTNKKFYVRFFGPESCGKWGSIRVDQARLFNKESAQWMRSKSKEFAKGDAKEESGLLEAIREALEELSQMNSDPQQKQKSDHEGEENKSGASSSSLPSSSSVDEKLSESNGDNKDAISTETGTSVDTLTATAGDNEEAEDKSTPMESSENPNDGSEKNPKSSRRRTGVTRRRLKKRTPSDKSVVEVAPPIETIAAPVVEQVPLEDMDVCYVCRQGGLLILCDGCNNACHCECASPPLEAIPDGEWFCMECQAKKLAQEQEKAKKEEQKKNERKKASSDKASDKKPDKKQEKKQEKTEKVEKKGTEPRVVEKSSQEKKTSERKPTAEKKVKVQVPRVSERVKNRKGKGREKLDHLNDADNFLEGDDYDTVMQNDFDEIDQIDQHISTVDDEIRPVDPVRRIFARNYWSQLTKSNFGEFQLFQNETLLNTTDSRRGRRTRRSRASIDNDDDGLQTILQLLKEGNEPAGSRAADKRKRQSKAHQRFVRSRKNYSDDEVETPHEPKRRKVRRVEEKDTESDGEATPITPLSQLSQEIYSRAVSGKHTYPTDFQRPIQYMPISSQEYGSHFVASPPIPTFSYMDQMQATKELDSHKNCLVYIRYRFTSESDENYRLIKKQLPVITSKKGISASSVCQTILGDSCVSPSVISEVRYFDFEEEGWLQLPPEYFFPVQDTEEPTTMQLLVYTPNDDQDTFMSEDGSSDVLENSYEETSAPFYVY